MSRICDNCNEKDGTSFWVTGAWICDDCKEEWEKKFEDTKVKPNTLWQSDIK